MSEDGQGRAKPGKRTQGLRPDEVAAILLFAEMHTDKETAENFGISERSVRRYRKANDAGQTPEVAAVVRKATLRREDLICDTLDKGLLALQARFAKMSDADLIDAVDKVGALRVQRDALTPPADLDAQHSESDQPGSRPAEGAGEDAGGAVRAPGAAGTPGAQSGAARVLQ